MLDDGTLDDEAKQDMMPDGEWRRGAIDYFSRWCMRDVRVRLERVVVDTPVAV